MHDRGSFWSAPPADWAQARIEVPGLAVEALERPALLVGGACEAWLAKRGLATPVGPRDTCRGESYALRLAPDSALVFGAGAATGGWLAEEGVAIAEAGDGWLAFELRGERARGLLAQGSEYPFDGPPGPASESARLLFAGFTVAVLRRAAGWRLHVERPWAPALWRWLEVHAPFA